MEKSLQIRKNKVHSIERKHPWIFSGAISSNVEKLEDGDLVTVYNHQEKVIARGHFQHATISVRVLTFQDEEINKPKSVFFCFGNFFGFLVIVLF